jgi:hypothetical protein
MATKAVAKVEEKSQEISIPFDSVPDYLPANTDNSGITNLDKDDFKTPRIVLLQGLSPELQSFPGVALANNFWHTGMNISLGEGFKFVPLKASKRVIVFRPRWDQGGGMLAMSLDAKTWQMGGNTKHTVKYSKDSKETVVWDTGKDVLSSRLTEWGTSHPDNDRSAPAATTIYEYLIYLPERPDLGPCVMSVSKTGLPYGKNLNTSLITIVQSGKPIYATVVQAFPEKEESDGNKWTVANFKMHGWATKDIYQVAKELADKYADYKVEYQQETEPVIDEIKY